VAFRAVTPDQLEWATRPHEPGDPARHAASLTDLAGFANSRSNFWRYEPGAKGRRHSELDQEETFVVLSGTLSIYLGEPPQRQDMEAGGVIHVDAGTPLQVVNHGDEELSFYAYGAPAEYGNVEFFDSAV
jgi:mannose-6-phosphate isomerase-like protein (cupin superfamily)